MATRTPPRPHSQPQPRPPRPTRLLTPRPPITSTCSVCLLPSPKSTLVQLPCTHRHCHGCLSRSLTISLSSTTFIPMKCCASISPSLLRSIPTIPPPSLQAYRARFSEHLVPASRRLHCHSPSCRAFIPPVLKGKCRVCNKKTCPSCGEKAHPTAICKGKATTPGAGPTPEELVLRLARLRGWRKCPNCGQMVEKNGGCNHVICRCMHEFCYRCGKPSMLGHMGCEGRRRAGGDNIMGGGWGNRA